MGWYFGQSIFPAWKYGPLRQEKKGCKFRKLAVDNLADCHGK